MPYKFISLPIVHVLQPSITQMPCFLDTTNIRENAVNACICLNTSLEIYVVTITKGFLTILLAMIDIMLELM